MAILKNYLDRISEGKPINFNQFLGALPQQYRHKRREIFSTELVSPNAWLVMILDDQVRAELISLAQKSTSRLEAAEKGNSHRYSATVSYLLVYHELTQDKRPDVIYLDDQQIVQGFASKSQLLLIENEENFFQYERMCLAVSEAIGESVSVMNTDVALGSGMKVASDLNVEWYQRYGRVICAFDYDLAGLQMFASLKENLQETVEFVQPTDYSSWIPFFKKNPDRSVKLQKARELAETLGFTQLSQAFSDTRKFMEQELMLSMVTNE